MFVIEFEQVNVPREAFNIIKMRHLNAQSSNKNTRKKCEIRSGEIIQIKMSGGSPRGKILRGMGGWDGRL